MTSDISAKTGKDGALPQLTRRTLLTGAGMAALAGVAGCAPSVSTARFRSETAPFFRPLGSRDTGLPPNVSSYAEAYDSQADEGYIIPAVPYRKIDPIYYRQVVADPTGEKPGTVVVDPSQRFLYFVQEGGEAMRYGVGVGRAGFAWSGRGVIQFKRKWPTWTPPAEMISREPELAKFSAANGGMDPGLLNPLGARALYIFEDGKDTLYRLHGSPEWRSIGKAVSSGCIRLMNQDVIDLYNRVPTHSPLIVV